MKVSYYPGCSLEVTAKSYNLSTQKVCKTLGVELVEVPEWVCCGSSAGLKMDRMISLSLAAKNLAMAETQAPADVMAPCPFCYRRLLSAQQEIGQDKNAADMIQQTIEADIKGDLNIQNLLGFFHSVLGLSTIRASVRKSLEGLKVIPYYGCYTVKPAQVTHFDNPENPTSMDEILTMLGADVLDWDFKTECCGASLSLSKTEKVLELSGRILKEAVYKEADVVVVACQLCQSNLDMWQGDIWKRAGKNNAIPVLYITQLMGLAFGLTPDDLGIKTHLVDPMPLLTGKMFI